MLISVSCRIWRENYQCELRCKLVDAVVDACTVNAFKARLDKFWKHQSVKFDFTADLTGTGNRSEEVIK